MMMSSRLYLVFSAFAEIFMNLVLAYFDVCDGKNISIFNYYFPLSIQPQIQSMINFN